MCSCDKLVYTEYNTVICTSCGLETKSGLDIVQKQAPRDMVPFPAGYSRFKRFSKILDGVLFPTPTVGDNLMLEYLFKKKTYASKAELIKHMKNAPLRDKRYTSLHLFCRLFVKGYQPPPAYNYNEVKKRIMMRFQDVEFGHMNKCPTEQFFNYNHLLVILLSESGLSEHIQFVKDLRCKRRKKYYKEMLERIRTSCKGGGAVVGVSESHTLPAERLDDLRLPPSPKETSEEMCVALLQTYTRVRTERTQSDSEVSYRPAHGGTPSDEDHRIPSQHPSESV